ncbi:hypothetical protein [Alicyclobacillus sp. SO9]|uniref:TlpA family protein disulfide reductase n=1 Tax=Alicyclobacillus sp. SO9 TaxID=2665646 RepID=UPI0018E7D942|nr:hypothetical protein [Alicyclobacillus sp. SO9]QQE78040.1 hypothetical protein GI364_19400 [Alicyclobacillus sp. SO9]
MKNRVKWAGLTAVFVGSLSLVGCGSHVNSAANKTAPAADAAGNPPFQNKLKMEIGRKINRYNPYSVNAGVFSNVKVETPQGKTVFLNANKQPILFTAYWCPHCQRTLVLLKKNLSQLPVRPIVVSMGFASGTTLAEAKKLETQEEKVLGLGTAFQIDYGLSLGKKDVPKGFPTLVYSDGTQLRMLYGEHTLKIWKEALAKAQRAQ